MSFVFKSVNYSNLLKYSIYLLILLFVFSKELIVLNEEFLIILSFLAVFFGLQTALSSTIVSELEDRTLQIKKSFLSLYQNKQNFQQILISLLEKKINLSNSLKNYNNLLLVELKQIVDNRNVVYKELVHVYTEQLLITYLLKYNLELKNVYLTVLKDIQNENNISSI